MASAVGKPLQPLRIPQGWEVKYNSFFETEPKFKYLDDTSEDFCEDMLVLANASVGVLIDLGWYPESEPKGKFGLVAITIHADGDQMSASWLKPLRELRTRSKRKVVAAIEEWTDYYSNGPAEPARQRTRRTQAR